MNAIRVWMLAGMACLGSSMAAGGTPQASSAPPATAPAASSSAPVVTLLDAGAEPRRTLRYAMKKGDRAATKMTLRMNVDQTLGGVKAPAVASPTMTFTITTEVVDVSAASEASIECTYSEADALGQPGVDPKMLEALRKPLQSMKGMRGRLVVTSRGECLSATLEAPAGADPLVKQQVEGMRESLKQFLTPVPEAAVGQGAKWRSDLAMASQGIKMTQISVCTLAGAQGDELSLDVRIEQKAEPQDVVNEAMPPGASLHVESLSGKGAGTMAVRLGSAMPKRSETTVNSSTSMIITRNGQAQRLEQRIEMKLELTDVPPPPSSGH